MAKILIVEDELPINKLIYKNLVLVGYECTSAYDGESALELILNNNFDLVLPDIMLPNMDGYEIMEYIKETPVILLTAKSSLNERVKGLKKGADDYIVKPFEMIELQARVEAVLRRMGKLNTEIIIDDLCIDLLSKQVSKEGMVIECTPKEFDLLEVLVKNKNIALSREKLLELVWGFEYEGDTRTIDVHIQKLRKKLFLEDYIKTVYKMGYRLEIKNEV